MIILDNLLLNEKYENTHNIIVVKIQ